MKYVLALGPIAQWLEQQTHNLLVIGSNPIGATNNLNIKIIINKINTMNTVKVQLENLYTFKANVYNENIGPIFGRTTKITLIANSKEEAYKRAKESFDLYINTLAMHYNNKNKKTITTFNYNDLKLV